jgi:hypothetical protein
MFTSKKDLLSRASETSVGRFDYLQSLVDSIQGEGGITNEKRARILAHFGNFAYDPVNVDFFIRLHIHDIFLDILHSWDDETERLREIAAFSLCNCCVHVDLARAVVGSEDGWEVITKALLRSVSVQERLGCCGAVYFVLKRVEPVVQKRLLSSEWKKRVLKKLLEWRRVEDDEVVILDKTAGDRTQLQNLCQMLCDDFFS